MVRAVGDEELRPVLEASRAAKATWLVPDGHRVQSERSDLERVP